MNKQEKVIVILGTARDDSNTLRELRKHLPFRNFELVDLHKLGIDYYDYTKVVEDDFLAVVRQMVVADTIVFATPVYWYAMSGRLKVFFDRLTELITTSKPLGRALQSKQVYLFATGSDPALPEGFQVPFQKTAAYFGMDYKEAFYVSVNS